MATLYNRQWQKRELLRHVGHIEQLAGIRLLEAGDGRSRGSRVLDVWTGSGLRFQVLADRALDISSCFYKGASLCWRSPNGDVHPAYYEAQGIGWLRSFQGGLLATCGLDQFAVSSQDADGNPLGLHGRIGNLPATQLNYRTYWDGGEYELEISGEVRQAALFGENLVLRRRITTRLGSNRIRIEDEVCNEGFSPHPHMILYHFNLGFPLVSSESKLILDAHTSTPRDAVAEQGAAQWHIFQEPTGDYQEQVFIHQPNVDVNGRVSIKFHNPELGLGLRWSYDIAQLPYLLEWKMMGEGAYVVGIEPANCNGILGQAAAREQDELPYLAPGESVTYTLSLEVVQV